MPNVINNLANEYAYKRDVAKVEQSQAVQVVTPADDQSDLNNKKAPEARQSQVIDSKTLALNVENLTQVISRDLEFTVDSETGTQVIRVIDSETGELVRQVPSDQILHIISHIQELKDKMVPGVLLDDKV